MNRPARVEVHLLDVPIEIWGRASAHHETLQREFDILRTYLSDESLPQQFVDLLEELDQRFAGIGDPNRQKLYAAAERGESKIDLLYLVPPDAAQAAQEVAKLMDQVDEFCRDGERLLTLATPPDVADFRTWYLGEFTRQIDHGLEPLPWSGFRRETHWADGDDGPGTIRFGGDLDLATAGGLRSRILGARGGGASKVTLDLSKVDLIDSVGISLLVTAHARLKEEGVEMRLILPEAMRRLIEISGLIELLAPEFVQKPQSK